MVFFLPKYRTNGPISLPFQAGIYHLANFFKYLADNTPHLNLGFSTVTTPTSISEGLKSIDRTVDKHVIAV